MKIIATLLALLIGFGAMGQEMIPHTSPAFGREPARARLLPTDKSGSTAPYVRSVKWELQSDGSYTSECSIPFSWANRQVLLRIAWAPAGYRLQVNDREAGHVSTGALAAEFNLTRHLKNDALNHLRLIPCPEAASRCLEDFYHPEELGASELISQPTLRVRDVQTQTRHTGEGYRAEVAVVVKCDALNEKQGRIYHELIDTAGRIIAQGFNDIRLRMRGEDTLRFTTPIPDTMLWSPDSPTRYRLRLRVQSQGRYTEYHELLVGFRQVALCEGELRINDKPLQPKIYEVRNPLGEEELQHIHTLGYNLLRLFPGVPAEEICIRADELGLCVVAMAPYCTAASGTSRLKGGNPSNNPAWRAEACDRAESSRNLTHRHPSVVAFALADDSANGICLYESYLHLKPLCDTRPVLYPSADGEWNSDLWSPKMD